MDNKEFIGGLICVVTALPAIAYLLGAWVQRRVHTCCRLPADLGGWCTLRETWTGPGRTAPVIVATRRVFLKPIEAGVDHPVYDVVDARDLEGK